MIEKIIYYNALLRPTSFVVKIRMNYLKRAYGMVIKIVSEA